MSRCAEALFRDPPKGPTYAMRPRVPGVDGASRVVIDGTCAVLDEADFASICSVDSSGPAPAARTFALLAFFVSF